MLDMRRREFITLVGSAAATSPFAARAQQPAMPVVGFLHSAAPDTYARFVAAFQQGLRETGYIDGKNVAVEYGWAQGQYDRLPALAAEMIAHRVSVIAATGGDPAALAAKAATTTGPIVFMVGTDPVQVGLVSNLSRPTGNVTGVTFFTGPLGAKRVQLLHQLVPTASVLGMLVNPTNPNSNPDIVEVQTAARVLQLDIHILNASTEREIVSTFATLVRERIEALVIGTDPFFFSLRDQIVDLAARHAVPTIYNLREYTDAGGLISYGTSLSDNYRQTGIYVGRILKGASPGDLPVVQPTTFRLVINLKTAKTLGLDPPTSLLAFTDDLIE
jgi:putative tryptophan/tyrosine transport system substrate-binding protein